MSERVKLNVQFENSYKEIEIGDQKIKVWEKIPYTDKIACAEEYSAMTTVIDIEKELAYSTQDDISIKRYVILKWYTNIAMDEYELDLPRMMDETSPYWKEIRAAISDDDIYATYELMSDYCYKTIDIYNDEHSLAQKIKMSLKGILNGEDLIETIAESRFVNEEMINLLTKAREHDEQKQNVVKFPWVAKKGE